MRKFYIDNNYKLTNYKGKDSHVIIPNDVKHIGSMVFYDNKNLYVLEIPDNVETIGLASFADCSNLSSIKFSNNLKILETNCFYGCKLLKQLVVPNSVIVIETSAFSSCISLESIEIYSSKLTVDTNAFTNLDSIKHIIIKDTIKVNRNSFNLENWQILDKFIYMNFDINHKIFSLFCKDVYNLNKCDINAVIFQINNLNTLKENNLVALYESCTESDYYFINILAEYDLLLGLLISLNNLSEHTDLINDYCVSEDIFLKCIQLCNKYELYENQIYFTNYMHYKFKSDLNNVIKNKLSFD